MSPLAAVRTCLAKYATFSGRAGRPEFWWFMLASVLAQAVATGADRLFFAAPGSGAGSGGPLSGILGLLMALPVLAAGWRRMHDLGRPGWHSILQHLVLIASGAVGIVVAFATGGPESPFAPAISIGPVVLAVATYAFVVWNLASPGEPGPNRFGPEPAA